MTTTRLALRTWARYAVPLTSLAMITLVPWLGLALGTAAPRDAHAIQAHLMLGWMLAATVWIPQLALVAGAAPLVRGTRDQQPIAQGAAVRLGLKRLVRAVAPTITVAIAVMLGMVALVVPGCVLLVLLATTNVPEPSNQPLATMLASAASHARRYPRRAIATMAGVVAVDLGVVLALQLALVRHISTSPSRAELASSHTFLRALALGYLVLSPALACLLAASRSVDNDPEPA